jgi:hypothetical protein
MLASEPHVALPDSRLVGQTLNQLWETRGNPISSDAFEQYRRFCEYSAAPPLTGSRQGQFNELKPEAIAAYPVIAPNQGSAHGAAA